MDDIVEFISVVKALILLCLCSAPYVLAVNLPNEVIIDWK